jgi:hypothetical protein
MLLAMPIASKTKNVAVYKKLRQAIIKGNHNPPQNHNKRYGGWKATGTCILPPT